MNRFFVDKEQILDNRIKILGNDVKHIKDVLRLGMGDKVEIVCDGKIYTCKILDLKSNMINTIILDNYKGKNEPPIHIALYQSIAKGNKMDFIIQKATEIGVEKIYPVITERTIVKIKNPKKEEGKVERWNSIAEEAAKQSKRDILPVVKNIISFNEMVDILKNETNIIVPYEMEDSYGLKEALNNVGTGEINIIIGPEGGFEEEEINKLRSIKGQVVTLGPRILRTETAGLVVSSIVLYELGDLGVIR
jgi:16S rRNA (uracil1498-N3)-methyltransferase